MSKLYNIQYSNGITKITFFEKPTFEEAQHAIDDVAENYPYEKRLWNLSESNFNFTHQEIINISRYGKSKFIKKNKMGIVATDVLVYGQMRQLMVYRKEEDKSDICVFKTEKEAITWLNQ